MTREEAADLRAAALVASLNAMPLSQRRALLERPISEYVPSNARMVVHPRRVCAPVGSSFDWDDLERVGENGVRLRIP